jgi:N-acylneuraminate cytidylyltransferase
MQVLALVTARGGSKGLIGKNLYPFLGRSLIEWSIEAAHNAKTVSRVVVSTDDSAIAAVAKAAGAEVPFMRPQELAMDRTLDLPVFQHALKWLKENEGYRPELVVHLRPTSPFRPQGLIDSGVDLLVQNPDADSVRSVCIPHNNPYKMWRIENGRMKPLLSADISEPYNQPRQLLPTVYWQVGALDVCRPGVIEGGSMSGKVILPKIMETAHAVDIDDIHSLRMAEDTCSRLGMAAR